MRDFESVETESLALRIRRRGRECSVRSPCSACRPHRSWLTFVMIWTDIAADGPTRHARRSGIAVIGNRQSSMVFFVLPLPPLPLRRGRSRFRLPPRATGLSESAVRTGPGKFKNRTERPFESPRTPPNHTHDTRGRTRHIRHRTGYPLDRCSLLTLCASSRPVRARPRSSVFTAHDSSMIASSPLS